MGRSRRRPAIRRGVGSRFAGPSRLPAAVAARPQGRGLSLRWQARSPQRPSSPGETVPRNRQDHRDHPTNQRDRPATFRVRHPESLNPQWLSPRGAMAAPAAGLVNVAPTRTTASVYRALDLGVSVPRAVIALWGDGRCGGRSPQGDDPTSRSTAAAGSRQRSESELPYQSTTPTFNTASSTSCLPDRPPLPLKRGHARPSTLVLFPDGFPPIIPSTNCTDRDDPAPPAIATPTGTVSEEDSPCSCAGDV